MKAFFKKTFLIAMNAIPVVIMIGLIPKVKDDFALAGLYVLIIALSLVVKRERKDVIALLFGFFVMTAMEYYFVNTGVEKFLRKTLFGLMPLWLPILWAYGFLAIKRVVVILDQRKVGKVSSSSR